jgi:hypothetical protein
MVRAARLAAIDDAPDSKLDALIQAAKMRRPKPRSAPRNAVNDAALNAPEAPRFIAVLAMLGCAVRISLLRCGLKEVASAAHESHALRRRPTGTLR